MKDGLFMILGVMILMGSMSLGVLAILNLVPPFIYILASILMGFMGGIIIMLMGILGKGILAPMISAKMSNKTMVAVLTANKNIQLEAGYETDGIVETDRGCFIVPTDTVYSWPNGVRGGLAFYKYGVTLRPDHIKACSILKKGDVNDINELEKINEAVENNRQKMLIDTKEES